MTVFYAGQRVRIRWSKGWPSLNGTEATVLRGGFEEQHFEGPGFYYHVQPDGWGSEWEPGGIYRFAPRGEQLEPLQDDKYESLDSEECPYTREETA